MPRFFVFSFLVFQLTACSVKDEGAEGGPCSENGTCDPGLICLSNLCVKPADAGQDAGPEADAKASDQQLPDYPPMDLSTPDIFDPDQAIPDLAKPDQLVTDLSAPDQYVPDVAVPDQYVPDVAVPDQGAVQCPSGQTNCSGTCVNTNHNPAYCGSCTNACTKGQVCYSGTCTVICSPGQTNCSGKCTNTASDPSNCGACANACVTGYTCVKGQCTNPCGNGKLDSGETCDGPQLNGQTCVLQGYMGSNLKCATDCKAYNSSNCFRAVGVSVKNSSEVHLRDIGVDSQGNRYVTGKAKGTISFGSVTLTVGGSNFQMFVAKLNPAGAWLWAVAAASGSGSSNNSEGRGISMDGQGNSYISGDTRGTVKYGSTTISTGSSSQLVVVKLSSGGSWTWAVAPTSTGSSNGYDIAIDSKGNPHVTGGTKGTVKYGSTTISTSSVQHLVVKLSSGGAWTWAVATTSTGNLGTASGNDIALDSKDNPYVTGVSQGTITYGTTTISAGSNSQLVVAKLSSKGAWTWAVASTSAVGSSGASGYDIALDNQGSCHITGTVRGTVSFGSTKIRLFRRICG